MQNPPKMGREVMISVTERCNSGSLDDDHGGCDDCDDGGDDGDNDDGDNDGDDGDGDGGGDDDRHD